VEETKALELGFSKEDAVNKEEHVGRSWTNVKFFVLVKPCGEQILGISSQAN
jgi:hypothetical protein